MSTQRVTWICIAVSTVSIAIIGTPARAQTDVRDPFGLQGLDRQDFRGRAFDPGVDRRPFVPPDFDDQTFDRRPFSQRDLDRRLDQRGLDEQMFDERDFDQSPDQDFDEGPDQRFDQDPDRDFDRGFDEGFDEFGPDQGPLDLRDYGRRDFGGRTFQRDFGGRRSLDRGSFSPRGLEREGLSRQGPGRQSGPYAGQSRPGGL